MNHRNTTLAVAAIIAAAAMTGVAFAIPQQVMAGGHGHGHGHNNHNSNGIKVDQQVNQLNACSSTSPSGDQGSSNTAPTTPPNTPSPSTICANFGANSAEIHH